MLSRLDRVLREKQNQKNQLEIASSGKKYHQEEIYLFDRVTYETFYFQTFPLSIKVNPTTELVAFAAPSRNLASYHYTGAEDSIEFDFTWYANGEDNAATRKEVLAKCKIFESLSKSDGVNGIHPVRFYFSDLFYKSTWLVEKAPYEISLFDYEYDGYPTLAKQQLKLVKISDLNPTHEDIRNLNT